jgi:predicted Zn-dependent peptidase
MKTKFTLFPFVFFLLLSAFSLNLSAQKVYKFETVPNDPLKARIYTLDNGLKVYISVYKNAPRFYAAIAVRTGSKNDPHDNTGLSHYLEHMMFKGTTHFGTPDYSKEAPVLQQIEDLFEVYRTKTDEASRKAIYHQIDSLSGVAAHLGIANEYDKLVGIIGAKGTNAFTSNEQTVYINDVPSNQLENWLKIEQDRFANPVFRIFHTELEAVYEEKNMSLDRDGDKVWEALYAGLFQKHQYGTQTTIGTIEHLKNPSLKALRNYYNERYVPNNMALCIAGDLDPDLTIAMVDKYLGTWKSKPVQHFVPPVEDPITQPIIKKIYGPDAENIAIGFRVGGVHTNDADLLEILSRVLNNGKAGLLDLNLNLAQKVLDAGASADILADYSSLVLMGSPKQGQSLDEVKDLLMGQLELVKKGQFADWLIPAVINNMKLQRTKRMESNNARAMTFADVFIKETPYDDNVSEIDRLSKITKQDIIAFANKNFTNNNYVAIYKLTGEDKNVPKVVKPTITPVVMNRDVQSDFLKSIRDSKPAEVNPVYVDFNKDIKKFKIKNGIDVLYVPNVENKTFSMSYHFSMGSQNDKKLAMAIDYLSYLGTSKMTPEKLSEEMYKLACSYYVSSSNNDIYVSVSGLSENMDKAVTLVEDLLVDPKPDQKVLDNMVSDILKGRKDNKLNKGIILSNMRMYGRFGAKNPATNILSETQLKELKASELTGLIKGLTGYKHEVTFYGNQTPAEMTLAVNKLHRVPTVLKPVPARVIYPMLNTDNNKVFMVNYDMKQVEIAMVSKSIVFNKTEIPILRLFNEYFGAGMNSIVFQEIREARALAYSSNAFYNTPEYAGENNYLTSYIGTQNDKLPEAMKAMFGLFNNMPEAEKNFESARVALLNKISTERITKTGLISSYMEARKMGYDHDIRKDVFNQIPRFTFTDLKKFDVTYLKDKNFNIMVLGNTEKLDKKVLESYGPVTPLTLEDVFGY